MLWNFQATYSKKVVSSSSWPWPERRGSTRRGKNHARKTCNPVKVSLYGQDSFILIFSKFRYPAHVKIEFGYENWVYSSAPTITQTRSERDVVAVARISDNSALPWSARSEASVFFSKCNAVRSERDVVAVRDSTTSNRPKPIAVLTCKTSPRTDERLLIGYSLPDFWLIWNNFKIWILQLQITLNPYEVWRAQKARWRWPPTHRLLAARFPAELKNILGVAFFTVKNGSKINLIIVAIP